MRIFAVLSLAVAVLAAPAPWLPQHLGALLAVKVPTNANTNVLANADAAVGNVKATYNTFGNNDANDNKVNVLSRGLANVLAPVAVPAAVAANADSNVATYADAAVANVNAQDNSIGNGDANNNKVKVLS